MAKRIAQLCAAGLAAALMVAPTEARAQAGGATADDTVDTMVARSLVDRGMRLFRARDYANAKRLFIEALERDPRGPYRKSATEMLRRANQKLGLYKDHGMPKLPPSGPTTRQPTEGGLGIEDPYSGADSGSDGAGVGLGVQDPHGDTGNRGDGDGLGVEDPYGGATGAGQGGDGLDVQEPYPSAGVEQSGDSADPSAGAAAEAAPAMVDIPADSDSRERARKELMVFGGGYGFVAGLAIAGDDDSAGGAGLVGGAAGVGIAHFATRNRTVSLGDAMAVESVGIWGASTFGFIGHIASGDDEYQGHTLARWSAAGGALGIAGGYLWASKRNPEPGHIAFTNSLAAYGTGAGLLVGLALPPAKSEAFSVNALVGGSAGVAAGLRWADELDPTRSRMWKIDLGAALGAGAPWVLIYPLIEDEGTNNDEQVVGFLSLAGLGGGAYLAYRWTRGDSTRAGGDKLVDLGPPALARRAADGTWALGMPMPRPVENPLLAPRTGAFNIGVDIVGGRF